MAEEETISLQNVSTWVKNLTTKGALELPEQLDLFQSLFLKDAEMSVPELGHVVATLKVAPYLANKYKSLHGGAIASLIDTYGFSAVQSVVGLRKGVSSDINITYISGAPLNSEIEIDARVLKAGRNIAVASVDVRNKETKKLLSQGRVTAYLLPPSAKM